MMLDVKEKYLLKVRECCLPMSNCPFRYEDLTCAIDEGCYVVENLKKENNNERKDSFRRTRVL